jgi:hypothetical protein
MTWKEFKDAVEKEGVKDEMKIEYIDWDGYEELGVIIDNPNQTIVIT